jgi:nicotinamidase-related amidase
MERKIGPVIASGVPPVPDKTGSLGAIRTLPETPMNYSEKLSRDNAAVILVDFLDGFLPGLRTIDHLLLRKNAEALTRLSSLFKLPTIMLGEEGSFRGNFFREVTDHAGHAIRVERHTPSAWDEPAFREALAETGRKKIILGGISLDICTLLLTLDLLGAGYEPYVVVDVSGSDTELNQMAAMMRMTQAGAVMVTVGSIASEIMGDWQTPEGATIGQIYQENSYWGRRL